MMGSMPASSRPFVRLLRRRGPSLALYAVGVVLVPLGLRDRSPQPTPGTVLEEPADPIALAAPSTAEPDERLGLLSGIWWRYEAGAEGERVRFYYFHGDGTGLYRYGRVGLTNTNSFDYDVQGDTLVLDFRKSGEHHEVRFSLERGEGEARDWLELHGDPREPGATRYFRESEQIVRSEPAPAAELGPPPAGHMWIDLRAHATGGRGFTMYQLRPAGIDGRGVGWFHRGDFDDWSTEWLTYRIVGDRIELSFTLADSREQSSFVVRSDEQGTRWLELADDPRDFWHPHRYVDMGPSFGMTLAPFGLDPER